MRALTWTHSHRAQRHGSCWWRGPWRCDVGVSRAWLAIIKLPKTARVVVARATETFVALRPADRAMGKLDEPFPEKPRSSEWPLGTEERHIGAGAANANPGPGSYCPRGRRHK